MYLKSLEIQGFKSFPDKTVVHFGNEITSIVGPNGSGKSNISDAISWVMGEQSSKALRGAKMEDVIFGGTLKRAQVGFAEASLILDNSDGELAMDNSEVMVTRRYYRSGDSEYYINKQTARLRDIHELFMDTGLGREGYSNIGQGRIDEILALKSGDRRQVFEEAAGISKYRHRKEETQRRLITTEDNLLRIGDKISELELQLEPLKRQSEKAKAFLELSETLKGLEVTVWLDSLTRLAAQAKKATEDFTSAKFILDQEQENLEKLYQQSQTFGEQLHERDVDIQKIRDDIGEKESSFAQFEGELAVLATNLENTQANLSRMETEVADQDGRTSSMEEQIQQKLERIDQLQLEITAGNGRLAELQQIFSTNQAELRDLTDQQGQAEKDLAVAETQLTAAQEQLENLQGSMTSYDSQKADLEAAVTQGQAHVTEAEQSQATCKIDLEQARENVQSAQNALVGYEMRIGSRKRKQGELTQKFQATSIALDTTMSRRKMLLEMERDFEGYSKAVRIVMQEKNRGSLSGVLMPVSQALKADDELSVAVETALGAAMQHLLVENEEAGKAAIQLLKRRDGGRATFLPVSTIRGRTLQEQGLENSLGFVGIASDLIEFHPKFRGVFENLLGRTVFVETLDNGIAMARKYSNRFRIVTLDGQVLNAGGSMTGGSASRSAGILSRANEVERLEKLAKEQEQEKNQLEQELATTNQSVAEVEFQMSNANGQLRQSEDEVLRLEGHLRQWELVVERAMDERKNAQLQLELLEQSGSKSVEMTVQLGAQIEAILEQKASKLEILRNFDEKLAVFSGENQAKMDEITQHNMEMATAHGEMTAAQTAVMELQALQQAMAGDRQQKGQWIAQYVSEIGEIQENIRIGHAEKLEKSKVLEEVKNSLQETLASRQALEAKKTKTEREIQDKNKDILSMERECSRLEQKKTSATMEEGQIIDKLWDNYQLTPSTGENLIVKVESISAATKEIQSTKRKISALGTPNLGAIEEFERVNERYEYLTSQRDDVLFAKGELESIIQSITTEMTEIFVREFAKINEYFGKTFVEMFGGGKGSLELDDPKEPLTCGIEIKVQPPGKQVKTITLLSGGEKAFVAIALYFSILRVRPTPFCLLDEIDAALDDNNVYRFANYLRNLSKNTQFIVITHRRGTMEASDVLYGVTMQEQGISKILHIDLAQMEQELGIYAR